MTALRETIAGTLVIAALVSIAAWYAGDTDIQNSPRSPFNAGETGDSRPPSVSVKRVDWSADCQKLLAFSVGHGDSWGCLTLHDMCPWSGWRSIDLQGERIGSTALAPDGLHMLVGTAHGHLWWVDLESNETITLVERSRMSNFSATAVAGDGRLVAAGVGTGQIYVCDPVLRTSVELPYSQSGILTMHFSHDGKRLVFSMSDGSIGIHDLVSGECLQRFVGHERPAMAADFLPDGKRIISAGMDDSVRIWDIASAREEWRGEFGLSGIRSAAVSPNGTTAAWGGFDRRIIVWDLELARKKYEIVTPASIIFHLSFSPDGKSLAVAGMENAIRIYDVATGAEREVMPIRMSRSL